MNIRKSNQIVSLAFERKMTLYTSFFFFIVGISAGVFFELYMSPDEKNIVFDFLSRYFILGTAESASVYPNPFFPSLASNIFMLFIIGISGLSIVGIPAAYTVLVYKGVALGFSAGLLIETMSYKGLFAVLTTVMPQNLILIPTFILAAAAAQNNATQRDSGFGMGRKNTTKKRTSPLNRVIRFPGSPYVSLYLFFSLLTVLGCLTEAAFFVIFL